MIKLKFIGYEIGATGHDISKQEFQLLKSKELIAEKINEHIENYDVWNANYFSISRPIIDQNLSIEVLDDNDNILWSGNCNDLCDIYDHASKFPEIEKIEMFDEAEQNGDAVAWEEHPYILYYEELNKGVVGLCNIDTKSFDPNHLSIVEGCLETDEVEWIYVNKIYYEGRPLKFEPLKHDLKPKYEKFKLIF